MKRRIGQRSTTDLEPLSTGPGQGRRLASTATVRTRAGRAPSRRCGPPADPDGRGRRRSRSTRRSIASLVNSGRPRLRSASGGGGKVSGRGRTGVVSRPLDEPTWISWDEAAQLVGCPVPTIDWYTRNGRIRTRPRRGARPTVARESAAEFASWWRERQAARAEARRLRKPRRRRKPSDPRPIRPDGWLTLEQAADLARCGSATIRRHRRRVHPPARPGTDLGRAAAFHSWREALPSGSPTLRQPTSAGCARTAIPGRAPRPD